MLTLRKISKEDDELVRQLSVRPDQQRFIAPVEKTLADAAARPHQHRKLRGRGLRLPARRHRCRRPRRGRTRGRLISGVAAGRHRGGTGCPRWAGQRDADAPLALSPDLSPTRSHDTPAKRLKHNSSRTDSAWRYSPISTKSAFVLLMRPRSGLAVGWSAVLCRRGFDAVRWTSEWLLPTRLLLPPQRLPDGLDVKIEASSKLFASTPGFFDNWVFPHCPMPRQVAVVYRSLAE